MGAELLQRRALKRPPPLNRPSTWFLWQAHWIRPGTRVLDVACGEGRHSLAAAALGASVVAVDRDESRLRLARDRAATTGLAIEWRDLDLEDAWPDLGSFDAVLVFNYLDRASMPRLLRLLSPGGVLIMETFLDAQRDAGWGPTSEKHLLRPGELARLVAPLKIVHGREVLEVVDSRRWRAVASIVARNIKR